MTTFGWLRPRRIVWLFRTCYVCWCCCWWLWFPFVLHCCSRISHCWPDCVILLVVSYYNLLHLHSPFGRLLKVAFSVYYSVPSQFRHWRTVSWVAFCSLFYLPCVVHFDSAHLVNLIWFIWRRFQSVGCTIRDIPLEGWLRIPALRSGIRLRYWIWSFHLFICCSRIAGYVVCVCVWLPLRSQWNVRCAVVALSKYMMDPMPPFG